MDYAVASVSHHTAPIDLRERLSVSAERLAAVYERFAAEPNAEVLVVSTCNRMELVTHGLGERGREACLEVMCDISGLGRAELEPAIRWFAGSDAVLHAFRVASGLDSMVLGEPQILGQWKDAFQKAIDAGAAGSYLNRLGQRTLQVAKRARTETDIGRFAVNLSALAVELAEEIFDPLAEKRVLVLGAGEMAELAVTHFSAKGIGALTIANRTLARAEELATQHGATAVAWDRWPVEFAAADVMLVGAGAEGHLLLADDVRAALRNAPRRPRLVIDLAVPRAVDPTVRRVPNIFLYSVDDLEGISRENRQKRQREAERAEELLREAIGRFSAWYGEQNLSPVLGDLNRWLEELRQQEVERTLRKGGGREPEKLLELATTALVRRLVQRIAQNLRGMPNPETSADILRQVLAWEDGELERKRDEA